MKKTLKIIGLFLLAILVFIAYKAYSYFKNEFADDVADSAVKEAKSMSIKDWFLSFLGMSTDTNGQTRTTLWDWLDKWSERKAAKQESNSGKYIV